MKIFVIVPVYNSKKYIDRCVSSILNQSYKNFCLFLVDDGSKDESYELCLKYAYSDSRITVIHQENRVAGAARNNAINRLSNEGYTVFVDSDDYIELNYFELLSKHDEDIVFIDVKRKDIDDGKICFEKLSDFSSYSKEKFLKSQITGKIWWGGVRKAVKSSLLINHNIRYSVQKICEEAIYSFEVLYYSKSIGFINHCVYNYEVRKNSLSHFTIDDPWGNVSIELKNKLIAKNIYNNYADTLNAFLLTATAVSLVRIANTYKGKEYVSKSTERIKEYLSYFDKNFKIDKKSLNFKVRLLRPIILLKFVRIFKILNKIFG